MRGIVGIFVHRFRKTSTVVILYKKLHIHVWTVVGAVAGTFFAGFFLPFFFLFN